MEDMKIAVIGLGKLGLPMAATFANSNFHVLGIDKDKDVIESLKSNEFNFIEPLINFYLKENVSRLEFDSDFSKFGSVNVAYLIVPTPSDKLGNFMNNFLLEAINNIGNAWKHKKQNRTLVIVSTVMPGSTRKILIPALEAATNEKVNQSLNVVYAPEFIAIGSVIRDLQEPDLLLIGTADQESAKQHHFVMSKIVKSEAKVRFLNFEEAELVKILINNFITTKITFANQIAELTDLIPGTDANIIAEAIGNDTRIGGKYLKPGLGFGGPCFPRDTRALAAFANVFKWPSELAVAVDEVNLRQPKVMANRILKHNKDVKKIGIYGLSYKAGSSLLEESQAIELANEFRNFGLHVTVYDPLVFKRPLELHEELRYVTNPSDLFGIDLLVCTQKIKTEDESPTKNVKKYNIF
jgi:UDPglucose 6-dehydrogenase